MALESGLLDQKWARDTLGLIELPDAADQFWADLDEESALRIALGMAWEPWYVNNLIRQGFGIIYQPGELCLGGIYITQDAHGDELLSVYYDPMRLCVHEIKTTSKSTNTVGDVSSQWMWVAQVKAQCKALSEHLGMPVLVGYLHMLFLYGDYKRPYRPQLKVARLQFTQEELDAQWEDIHGYVQDQLAKDRYDAGLEQGA